MEPENKDLHYDNLQAIKIIKHGWNRNEILILFHQEYDARKYYEHKVMSLDAAVTGLLIMYWLRVIARHFQQFRFFLPQEWGVDRTKAQASYCWDFQGDITTAVGDHAPKSPAAIHHIPLPQPFTHPGSKASIDCHVLLLWSACGWAPENVSISCFPLNHGIAMDQLWQPMKALGNHECSVEVNAS